MADPRGVFVITHYSLNSDGSIGPGGYWDNTKAPTRTPEQAVEDIRDALWGAPSVPAGRLRRAVYRAIPTCTLWRYDLHDYVYRFRPWPSWYVTMRALAELGR